MRYINQVNLVSIFINYYINNYKSGQDIIVSYKDHRFLVSDDIFLISWSDLYDLFNLNTLDVSLMHCFTL
jgi:hypothetical protein